MWCCILQDARSIASTEQCAYATKNIFINTKAINRNEIYEKTSGTYSILCFSYVSLLFILCVDGTNWSIFLFSVRMKIIAVELCVSFNIIIHEMKCILSTCAPITRYNWMNENIIFAQLHKNRLRRILTTDHKK